MIMIFIIARSHSEPSWDTLFLKVGNMKTERLRDVIVSAVRFNKLDYKKESRLIETLDDFSFATTCHAHVGVNQDSIDALHNFKHLFLSWTVNKKISKVVQFSNLLFRIQFRLCRAKSIIQIYVSFAEVKKACLALFLF